MNEIIFKVGDRVRLVTEKGAFAKIVRIFHAKDDGMPPTDLFVLQRETVDPLSGSTMTTAFRYEIGPIDVMDAERLRRRMAFEIASGRKG